MFKQSIMKEDMIQYGSSIKNHKRQLPVSNKICSLRNRHKDRVQSISFFQAFHIANITYHPILTYKYISYIRIFHRYELFVLWFLRKIPDFEAHSTRLIKSSESCHISLKFTAKYMWWHIDVQAEWRRLTYGRAPTS